MQIENTLSNELGRYIDLATGQAKLTAQNMANIDTPGYRAAGMDFAAEMRSALDGVRQGKAPDPIHIQPEEGLIARPDGNNVSMDHESLHLAEAQLKLKTGVALLRQQYQQVMDAIHADK